MPTKKNAAGRKPNSAKPKRVAGANSNNRVRGGPAATPANPSTSASQRALRKPNPKPNMMAGPGRAYAMCRLNPFSGGSAMYPGGGNAPIIVVDHRTFADVDPAAINAMHIRILPCAPFSSALHFGNGLFAANISNNKISGDLYGPMPTTGTDTQTAWYPLNIMQEWSTASFPGAGTIAPFRANRARITSCGFRLTYTGTPTTCRGLISMTQGSLSVVSRETLPFGVDIRTQLDALGTTIVANSSDAVQIEGDVTPNPCNPSTVTVRMDQGASGTLQQISETLPFRPIAQGGAVMFADGKTTNYFVSTTGVRGAVGFIDESWSPIDIYVSNIDTNSSFRVEVATCVEYQVDTSSDVARFARNSPPANPSLVNSLQAATTKLPSFGDLHSIEETAKRLLPMVKTGASLLSSLGAMAL